VSDAQYWGYYSVCGLLMRYRDLFRSERGLKPWADIKREDIGAWIERKETEWPELEKQELRRLTIDGETYHPFEVEAINKALNKEGLVYGAGYGMYLKPTFFVAELRSVREISGLTVYTAGKELVRDLFTSPAMLQEKIVFLRIEPLMVLLMYKHSELNARSVSMLEDAFAAYGFPHRQIIDAAFEQRMEEMALRYSEILLAHEVGEAAEEVPEWKDILSRAAGDRQAEHLLRAVKDLLADTSEAGPYKKIIDARDRGALGLSISLAEGFRRLLFPEIKEAFAALSEGGDWTAVEQARRTGYERFRSARDEIVGLFRREGGRDGFIAAAKETLRKIDAKK
jgi:hypothetical protein